MVCLITEPKLNHSERERKGWGPELGKIPWVRSGEKQYAFGHGLWGQAGHPRVGRMEDGESRESSSRWPPQTLNYCSPNLHAACVTTSQIKTLVGDT